MQQLGKCIASVLPERLTIALCGNLGAGKTLLSKSISQGLGIPEEVVTSPTFVLIQEYYGSRNIAHCDTYRLRSSEDLLDLGIEEYFEGDWICLVEWADRVEDILPEEFLKISIEHRGETSRSVTFEGHGEVAQSVISQVLAQSQMGAE